MIAGLLSKKLIYPLAAYEVLKVLYEFRKRDAKKIVFEIQKRAGKFSIYIDSSIYKELDVGIGISMAKYMYTVIMGKSEKDFEKNEIKNEKSSEINFNLLPLPKGKCLSYSHLKKEGDIFIMTIEVKSNLLSDYFKEKIEPIYDKLETNRIYYMPENVDSFSPNETFEIEDIGIKTFSFYYKSGEKVSFKDGDELKLKSKKEIDNLIKNIKIE